MRSSLGVRAARRSIAPRRGLAPLAIELGPVHCRRHRPWRRRGARVPVPATAAHGPRCGALRDGAWRRARTASWPAQAAPRDGQDRRRPRRSSRIPSSAPSAVDAHGDAERTRASDRAGDLELVPGELRGGFRGLRMLVAARGPRPSATRSWLDCEPERLPPPSGAAEIVQGLADDRPPPLGGARAPRSARCRQARRELVRESGVEPAPLGVVEIPTLAENLEHEEERPNQGCVAELPALPERNA